MARRSTTTMAVATERKGWQRRDSQYTRSRSSSWLGTGYDVSLGLPSASAAGTALNALPSLFSTACQPRGEVPGTRSGASGASVTSSPASSPCQVERDYAEK